MNRLEYKMQKVARVARITQRVNSFTKKVRTEEDAVEFILELYRELGGFKCKCGNVLTQKIRTRKTQCGCCRRDCWITAGTIFENARKLLPYLIAVDLRMNGVDFCKGELAAVTGIASSTADEIMKKIAMVSENEMTGKFQEIDSLSFLGIYNRRSLATPQFAHPRMEEEEFQLQRDAGPVQDAKAEAPALSEIDELVYNAIPIEPVSFNILLARTQLSIPDLSLSLINLVTETRLIELINGEQYRRKAANSNGQSSAESDVQIDEVDSFTQYMRALHGGCSHKYVQLYAANYWCSQGGLSEHNALFLACLRFGPKSRRDILDYVTPATIKFVHMEQRKAS